MRAPKLLVIGITLFLTSVLGTEGQTVTQEMAHPTVTVPPLITFGGVLKGRSGQPLTGVVGLTFSLYKDQQGGVPVWTENQNVQLDAEGRYTTLLGATQASGLPMDLFASGQSRWLGVQAQLPGEDEQPRVLLVSVPYALKAADADTIGGRPASAFVLAPSVSTPSVRASADAIAPNTQVSAASTTGSGTTGKLTKFTDGTNGVIGDSVIAESNGNIGVGTSTPGFRLDVAGGIEAFGGQYPQIGFRQDGSVSGFAAQEYRYQIDPDGSYRIYDITHGVTPRFTLAPGGNVGIGATSPGFALDVKGGIQAAASQYPQINFRQLGTTGFTPQEYRYQIDADAAYRIYDITNGVVSRFTLTNAGNVGIGTSVPGARLDINGQAKAVGFAGDGSALTNLTPANITGTLANNQTTATASNTANSIVARDASGNFSAGAITANTFSGSGAGLTNINATTVNGIAGTSFNNRGIVYLAGCDTCSVLQNTDSQNMIYLNVIGAMTINSITCYSDAGTPIINIHRAASANNVLSSNLTCSTSGATSTSFTSGETTINPNDTLDFVMVTPGGTAHRVTVAIKATVN
jgi:hypothetical protein